MSKAFSLAYKTIGILASSLPVYTTLCQSPRLHSLVMDFLPTTWTCYIPHTSGPFPEQSLPVIYRPDSLLSFIYLHKCHFIREIFFACLLWTEILCPSKTHMMKPEGDDIWKWGLWEVIRSWRWSLHDGISVLIRRGREQTCSLPAMCRHNKKWPSPCQKESPHQEPNLLAPWSWTSHSRIVRNKYLLLKPPCIC